jgi:hypothetical protein
MTELREQLLSARDEYRSARYPGDLADEVLPPAAQRSGAAAPWGVRTFLVRVGGIVMSVAAVVALVLVRPPEQQTAPAPRATHSGFAHDREVATARVGHRSQVWRFPPDLTFASEAAERVKTVATRVQMRMTRPYRDLMPEMPELPSLWPGWTRNAEGDGGRETGNDAEAPPQAGPSTQQAA